MNSPNNTSFNIVFIAGHARSGTSVFSRLFDGHSQILAFPGESHIFINFLRYRNIQDDYQRFLHIVGKGWDGNRKVQSKTFIRSKNWRPLKYYEYLESADKNLENHLIPFVTRKNPKIFFIELVELLNTHFWTHSNPPRVIMEKCVGNETFFPYISDAFSNVKFLYIVRNPFHVIHSYLVKQNKFYRDVSNYDVFKLTASWKSSCNLGLGFAHSHPDKFLLVKFEDLVEDTYEQMSQISRFIGIQFENSLLAPSILNNPWSSNTHRETKLQPGLIDKKALKKDITNLLNPTHLDIIEKFTRRERHTLNYQLPDSPSSFDKKMKNCITPFFVPRTRSDLSDFITLYFSGRLICRLKTHAYKTILNKNSRKPD